MRAILKGDYYETDLILDCNNCKIVSTDTEWTFIKVEQCILERFRQIKRDINKIVIRNPEFYCDCKKYVKYKDIFEELIKVKTNHDLVGNDLGKLWNIKLELEKIWIGKSSYGPLLRILNIVPQEHTLVNFVNDPDITDSDEEINDHFEIYNNQIYNNQIYLKKTDIKKKKRHGKRSNPPVLSDN